MQAETKAEVFVSGHTQAVRIPAQYRFDTDYVYLEHDPEKGTLTLSEKPLHPSEEELAAERKSRLAKMAELFARMDADGGFNFEWERDNSPAPERELL